MTWQDVGPVDGDLGAPSQMVIFDQKDSSHHRELGGAEQGSEDQSADQGLPSNGEE
jgi:hypothetical protein